MRIPRSLLALAVVVGAFAVPLAVPFSPATALPTTLPATTLPATTVAGSDGLVLQIVPDASGVLRPGQDLAVTVTVENLTDASIPEGSADIFLGRSLIPDLPALTEWLAASDDDTVTSRVRGDVVATVETPALFVGQAIVLPPIVIPAATVALDEKAAFGSHRLSIVDSAADGVVDEARSTITVDPGTGTPSASLALAMPIVVPATSLGLLSADILAGYTSATGLLTRQLDDAIGRPIALGVDPRILASIRVLGTSAPDSAVAWLARLEAAPNDTFALAYADADVAASSQAGSGVVAPTSIPVDSGLFAGAPPTQPSPSSSASPAPVPSPVAGEAPTLESLLSFDYSIAGLAWPRATMAADLDTFSAAGLPTTLLSSSNVSPGDPDVMAAAAATVGTHAVLVSDDVISTRFRAAVNAGTPAQWQAAMASLTATLATVAADGGPASRVLLATLGHEWTLGGFRLAQTLDALATQPWSTPAILTSAIAQVPGETAVVDQPVAADRLDLVRQLFASEGAVAQFATVIADPTAITGPQRLTLLALLSSGWAADDTTWPALVTDYLGAAATTLGSVNVETGTITQWSDNGPLPITISNSLGYPVTLYVTVQPRTAILEVRDSRVEVTVEANSQNRASIPVQSVANGQVVIAISLASATGVPISQPAFVEITVQAGWETAATAALGAILVVVFALGIVRTVRRRRRIRRGELPDGDGTDDDSGRADVAEPPTSAAPAPAAAARDSTTDDLTRKQTP
ncbi:MAG: hypothetical protein H7146_01585 [Burkholderiaceae bacterium]|nr:hypothetical protein [Microbacteriaceae bacterium]